MEALVWLFIIGFVLYLVAKVIKRKREKVRNVAADYGSNFGPWGALVSGVAKSKGYGSENASIGVEPNLFTN